MATHRGKIVSFSAGTYLAVIRLDGSGAQAVAGVAVNRAIASGEMVAGRTVVIDSGEGNVAGDLVVLAVIA